MKLDFSDFDRRSRELQLYLDHLQHMESVSGPGHDDVFKMMKASFFLVAYNLIESTAKQSFEGVFNYVNTQRIPASDVSKSIFEEWVAVALLGRNKNVGNPKKLKENATNIARIASSGDPLVLPAKDMQIRGSVDAKAIRDMAKKLGINLNIHYRANGGVDLEIVKEKRHALAHGDMTFSECGREFTVDDLRRISNKVMIYMRSIARSMRRYIEREDFKGAK